MFNSRRNRREARFIVFLTLMALALGLPGCEHFSGYLGFWERHRKLEKEFREEASAGLLRELHPEDAYLLVGRVSFNKSFQAPLLLAAVTDQFQKREIVAERILQPPVEYYQAYLPEGNYDLYFFADLDGNGYFDPHEMVGQTSGKPIRISRQEVKDGLTFNGPPFTLDLGRPAKTELPIRVPVREHAYVYASLDDPFFDPKYGMMGLYDPKKMLTHTQRYIFSLEKFDPEKTVVIFVHGIGGTPRDFKYLAEGLDKTRFQPWFFFYPTGMPLQKSGSLLGDILKLADQSQSFKSKRVIVVAHSMGGLVSLAGLNQLCADGAPPYLKAYISFDSPYGGVEAAKMAGKMPAVVPSWTDIAKG
ncbi:MAG TPA: alpha/beta hydrolase, partial [Thermodesulfobacteriota bacterium]|nr:alpha/beta hydrolase [Thermodesulfobacteriota bacterium]